MKKLILPLILLSSAHAFAFAHDEFLRIAVSATDCQVVQNISVYTATCTRTGLGNSTVVFGKPFVDVPVCTVGSESLGAVMSFTPSTTGMVVASGLAGTGAGVNASYALHCYGY